jgi:hypothetical protein
MLTYADVTEGDIPRLRSNSLYRYSRRLFNTKEDAYLEAKDYEHLIQH